MLALRVGQCACPPPSPSLISVTFNNSTAKSVTSVGVHSHPLSCPLLKSAMFSLRLFLSLSALLLSPALSFHAPFLASSRLSSRSSLRAVVNIDNAETFDTAIAAAKGLVVIDYSTTWCGPCKVSTRSFFHHPSVERAKGLRAWLERPRWRVEPSSINAERLTPFASGSS